MSFSFLLKLSIFFTGFSGLVAEYVVATLATYLLGNAVFQWSLVIAFFLLFMGLGSRLSRYLKDEKLLNAFILTELSLSVLVSLSPIVAYSFASEPLKLQIVVLLLSAILGTLIGLEIPVAVRLNNLYEELKINVSSILEKDYLGSLPAGLLYSLVLLPKLGILHTALIAGLLNLFVASLFAFRFSRSSLLKVLITLTGVFLILYGIYAKRIYLIEEQRFYGEKIELFKQTPYQKIVLTRYGKHYSLYLDGHLQFSTLDEKYYHEAIVHVPMSFVKHYEKALILGGGDGLALRELLKYPFKEITLVELDREMIRLSKENPVMRRINKGSFYDPRVKVVIDDAFNFVFKTKERYDFIVIDLIDPRTPSAARVYSLEFYRRLRKILHAEGVFITQATDIFFNKKAFCCILNTIKAAGFKVSPFHINVPSMGDWGFVIGSFKDLRVRTEVLKRFREDLTSVISRRFALSLFSFPKGYACRGVEISTLIKPKVLDYYYMRNY